MKDAKSSLCTRYLGVAGAGDNLAESVRI